MTAGLAEISTESRKVVFVNDRFLTVFFLLLFFQLFFELDLGVFCLFLFLIAALYCSSDEDSGWLVEGILFAFNVAFVLLFKFTNTGDSSFQICLEIGRSKLPVFIEIDDNILKLCKRFGLVQGKMNLVLLSFFEDQDVALDFSQRYVLDFKIASELLYELFVFGGKLERGVLNYTQPVITNQLNQAAHENGLYSINGTYLRRKVSLVIWAMRRSAAITDNGTSS